MREDAGAKTSEGVMHFITYLKKKFPKNRMIISCENKPLGTMKTIANLFQIHDNTYFVKAGNPNTMDGLGVNPTQDLKSLMFNYMNEQLHLDAICLSPEIEFQTNISLNYNGFRMPDKRTLGRNIFEDNLKNVVLYEKVFSGKGKRGKDHEAIDNDDLSMATVYALYNFKRKIDPRTTYQESIIDLAERKRRLEIGDF